MVETAIRKLVKETRGKLGMSQSEFAKYLGFNVASLLRWEAGSAAPGGLATARLIESGVEVASLINAFEADAAAKREQQA